MCEAITDRVPTLAPLFKFLDNWQIPHLVFVNKMHRANILILETLQALKAVSSRPLVTHQYPIIKDEELTGFIDLVTEQAYKYQVGKAADPIPFPESLKAEEHRARVEMLEALANFDAVYALAIAPEKRNDEVKLSGAIAKLLDLCA